MGDETTIEPQMYDQYREMRPELRREHERLNWFILLKSFEISNSDQSRVRRMWLVEQMRKVLLDAAKKGVEQVVFWRGLGELSEGEDRLDAYTRAVACLETGQDPEQLRNGNNGMTKFWMAECLYEVAQHHAEGGKRTLATDFLSRAEAALDISDELKTNSSQEMQDQLREKMDLLSKKLRQRR